MVKYIVGWKSSEQIKCNVAGYDGNYSWTDRKKHHLEWEEEKGTSQEIVKVM